jgi:tripartite-type tricarboxylate transporter receptor subunit TctC
VAARGQSTRSRQQAQAAASKALSEPEVKDKLLAIGLIPVATTPDGLTQELAANTAFWQPIVKATGYKITN